MVNLVNISNNAVFFVHIPKCAGTSLGSFFGKKLRPSNEFFWHGQDGDINEMAEKEQFTCIGDGQGIRFFGGHYTLPTAAKIINDAKVPDAKIFSVIRNPVEQAESYFNWITSESVAKQAEHPFYERAKDMSPFEFFQDEIILSEVSNIQSKYLLGVNCEESSPNEIQLLSLHLLLQNNIYVADVTHSDEIAHGVANILSLNTVENDEQSRIPRENVSAKRIEKFDSATIALIREIFWGDIMMYDTLSLAFKTAKHNFYF